jgi:hypothetical protein
MHGNTYYRIHALNRFDELMIVGSRYMLVELRATIFPEFQLIADLLENTHQQLETISKEVFEEKLTYCRSKLTEKKV